MSQDSQKTDDAEPGWARKAQGFFKTAADVTGGAITDIKKAADGWAEKHPEQAAHIQGGLHTVQSGLSAGLEESSKALQGAAERLRPQNHTPADEQDGSAPPPPPPST